MSLSPVNVNQQIVGGQESQVVVGAVLFPVQNNLRGIALTVRTQGTVIAAIQVRRPGAAADEAYAPTWLGIALNQGDYFVALYPIVSITLTAGTDSVTLHCNARDPQ